MQSLREIYATIRDGETTWAAIVDATKPTTPAGIAPGNAKALEDDLRRDAKEKPAKASKSAKAEPAKAEPAKSADGVTFDPSWKDAPPHDPATGEIAEPANGEPPPDAGDAWEPGQ